jgi:hypothetical protein
MAQITRCFGLDDRFHETHPIGCHHSSLASLACRSYILVTRSWSAYDSNHGSARLVASFNQFERILRFAFVGIGDGGTHGREWDFGRDVFSRGDHDTTRRELARPRARPDIAHGAENIGRSNQNSAASATSPSRRELSTFASLAFNTCSNIPS